MKKFEITLLGITYVCQSVVNYKKKIAQDVLHKF